MAGSVNALRDALPAAEPELAETLAKACHNTAAVASAFLKGFLAVNPGGITIPAAEGDDAPAPII